MNKTQLNTFNRRVNKFFELVAEEERFSKNYPKAKELVVHFIGVMKLNHMYVDKINIKRSEDAAIEMITTHDYIPFEEWKECITWILNNKTTTTDWWRKVPIRNLKNIQKLYVEYKTYKDTHKVRRFHSDYT